MYVSPQGPAMDWFKMFPVAGIANSCSCKCWGENRRWMKEELSLQKKHALRAVQQDTSLHSC